MAERFRGLEEREREFELFQEGKRKELEAKREEFDKEVEMRVEELDEHREWLQVAQNEVKSIKERACKKLQEIELREEELRSAKELLDASEKELVLKEEQFVKMVKLMDEKFRELDKLGCDLIETSGLADSKLREMSLAMHTRFHEIELKEREFVAASVQEVDLCREKCEMMLKDVEEMERKFNALQKEMRREFGLKEQELNRMGERIVQRKKAEVESKAKELEIQKKGVERKESYIYSREKELHKKRKSLRAWERELVAKQREVEAAHELNKQRTVELDKREINLDSVRSFTRTCFEEHLELKKKMRIDKDLGNRSREPELRGKDRYTEIFNAPIKILPDESVDLKFVVTMNGQTLQLFLNDHEDLELMGGETLKILHLSSDPAKLVLDAMEGFYPPHLRKGDTELKVMKTCTHLLEQLIKMSPKITPSVRVGAIGLANEWKSKMRIAAENQMEVLGFLHLLAAYSISLLFERDELQSFLNLVAQQRQAPELCRILGLTKSNAGLIDEDLLEAFI